jgi:hypothetical protein
MAQFSNNPQSAYNGLMSGHRNMFLLSSVAIAMYGFLKNQSIVFVLATAFIFLFAAYVGIQASLDFDYYIHQNQFPRENYRFGQWQNWKYVGITYGVFLIILGLLMIIDYFKLISSNIGLKKK